MSDTKVRVKLYSIDHIGRSRNGNSRYAFHTSYGLYRTKVDTSKALSMEFPDGERLDIDVELTLANGNTNSVYDWKKL